MHNAVGIVTIAVALTLTASPGFAENVDSANDKGAAKAHMLMEFRKIVPAIRASKAIAENYALCPLKRGRSSDLAAKFGEWLAGGEPDHVDCSVAIKECWDACDANLAWACRDLGNLAHDFNDQIGKDITRRLYAQGCALGDPNACTNRAANIVNATWEGDPVEPLDDAKRAQCTIVMYEDACDANEYWGCSQVGIERSEVGPASIRDEGKAATAARKACTINAKDQGTDGSEC